MLKKRLSDNGISVSAYSFPGNEPRSLGNLIYDLHHNINNYVDEDIDPISLQLLHVAAHIDALNKKIIPDLNSGKTVLLDRSWWSTYTYGIASGIDRNTLNLIISPEIEIMKTIKKIKYFLINRNLKCDENNNYDLSILNAYKELGNNATNKESISIIENNDLDKTLNEIYEQIFTDGEYLPKLNTSRNQTGRFPTGIEPSSIYSTYWKFATKRQEIFYQRQNNTCACSDDPILQNYKFTNAYRASDRVSQYLIRNVIYNGGIYSNEDTIFRILLFKLFNKIETWQYLEEYFGDINYQEYSFQKYDNALMERINSGNKIYSAAYIMPSANMFGYEKKHRNNLMLLESIMNSNFSRELANAKSLKNIYEKLLSYPSIGKFLAFQYTIDINYSELCDFSEMSFVIAGPGAQNGIKKCFESIGRYSEEDIIRLMAEKQEIEFDRYNLDFQNLWGRSLQLIDCQNLFCEVDKYSRVAFPNIDGIKNKSRIKQHFHPKVFDRIQYFYPPKWGINERIDKVVDV